MGNTKFRYGSFKVVMKVLKEMDMNEFEPIILSDISKELKSYSLAWWCARRDGWMYQYFHLNP